MNRVAKTIVLVALLALAFALPLAPAAQAQEDPAATVKDDGDNVVLKSFVDGGLLAPEQNGGAIPKEGAGARMMWYPGKAAFRAGEVGGSQWNNSNVGSYSVAFGLNTTASGTYATVGGGESNTASDGRATVGGGRDNTASDDDATVGGGRDNTASGASATVGGGNGNTASGADATVGGGLDNMASGERATVPGGQSNEASGDNATAMGEETTAATKQSLSLGECNDANRGSADGTLLVVGNGDFDFSSGSCDSNSDALELDGSGNLEIAGDLTENSDRRLKTDIDPLSEGVLGALGEIDPVRYRFKNEQTHPSGEQIGLIAQEVRKQFPELVREGSGGMLSLAYPKLTAVLLKGLQEQQSTIEEQKGRIAALEMETDEQSRKIADLKAENEEIKDRLAALETSSSSALSAGLGGSWALALLMGLGGLGAGLLGAGFLALRRR